MGLMWVIGFWTFCESISKFRDLYEHYGSLETQMTPRAKFKVRW
jgi:hypothetical protein